MRKLRCLIVEDEPIARKIIKEFIGQIDFLELAGEVESAVKAELFFHQDEPDLLFLDIEMPRLSGLEYLKSRKVKPIVIITTAYPEYALEGYSLDVIDYLLKPIAFARFFKAVQKAKEYHDLTHQHPGKASPESIFVRSDKKIEKINIEDILFIESAGNYVTIACKQKKLTVYLTFKSIEGQLPPGVFVKIHQSFLVNFLHVENIEGNQLRVGGKTLSVSRRFRESLFKRIDGKLLRREN